MMGEEEIPLAQVPTAVVSAAEGAVEGFDIKAAESKVKDGRTVYDLEGKANGVKYEVKVAANGEVLKVEEE